VVQVRGQVRNRRRKHERPEEILAAALTEFVTRGYGATSIEQVARRAGVAKGTVYLYFPSKEALFKAVVQRSIAARFQDLGEAAAAFTGSTEEFLRGPLRQMLGEFLQSEARGLVRTLVAEAHLFPDLAEFYYREVVLPALGAIRLVIARGDAAGELRQAALDWPPQLLLAPAPLVILWEALFSRYETLDREGLIDAYLDLLWDGLRAPSTWE
jgi:AcrR family transcriptional regulator